MTHLQVKTKKNGWTRIVLLVIVLFAVATLVLLLFFTSRKNDKNNSDIDGIIDPGEIVTTSVAKPEETDPAEFPVAYDMPKRILIPSIGVEGFIQRVGVDQNYQIAVPSNVHLAGWYVNSVKPGEIGLSIMDGHRDGSKIGGIFRNIVQLQKGDELQIEYGDGSIKKFLIVEVHQVPTEDAYALMYEKKYSIERQLNLVSCGGKYSKSQNTYEDRIIVVAEGI